MRGELKVKAKIHILSNAFGAPQTCGGQPIISIQYYPYIASDVSVGVGRCKTIYIKMIVLFFVIFGYARTRKKDPLRCAPYFLSWAPRP